MRIQITRTLLAGLAVLASVGISHATEASASTCAGFPMESYVVTGDTLSGIVHAAYVGIPHDTYHVVKLIAGQSGIKNPDLIFPGERIILPCPTGENTVARKRFVAPTTAVQTEAATIVAPEITLDVQEELPMFASALSLEMDVPAIAPPQPEEHVAVAHVAHVPLPEVVMTEKEADQSAELSAYANNIQRAITAVQNRRHVKGYEVTLHIPSGQVQGASAGTFSALFLENQNEYGEWRKWKKITTELQETSDGLLCTIILKAAPPQNSAVAIDFANGHSIFIASDLLAQGELTTKEMAKARPPKTYSALALANRLKPNKTLKVVRFIAPTVMRSGLAFALTGPFGLVMAPASLVTDIATAKIRKSQRLEQQASQPQIAVEYAIAGQASQIEKLEHEVEMLKMQINSAGQTRNQLASNVEEKQ